MPIEKMLDLSTAHMPGANAYFGDIRFVEHAYGYIVFVRDAESEDDKETITPWFLPILKEAQKQGCLLILLDRDAETHEGLKTYDW